jgi:hypothetical protein
MLDLSEVRKVPIVHTLINFPEHNLSLFLILCQEIDSPPKLNGRGWYLYEKEPMSVYKGRVLTRVESHVLDYLRQKGFEFSAAHW